MSMSFTNEFSSWSIFHDHQQFKKDEGQHWEETIEIAQCVKPIAKIGLPILKLGVELVSPGIKTWWKLDVTTLYTVYSMSLLQYDGLLLGVQWIYIYVICYTMFMIFIHIIALSKYLNLNTLNLRNEMCFGIKLISSLKEASGSHYE